ncbi:MAG: hypothetical protein IKO80_06300 [Lachnospiraceae bacterium]|jgi:hypothetical protein|nr:hypothetical protein [Lachnospiraceae bacterium]
MLTMILVILVLAGGFRLMGYSLRIFGAIIGMLIGVMITVAILSSIFGLIGALATHVLPVAILVGIGIFIGRRLRGDSMMIDRFRDRAQEVIDANGRMVR